MANPEEIARRWFKAIEDHDVEGAQQLLSPDVDFLSPAGTFTGSEGAGPFLQGYVDAFPDLKFQLSNVFASGDRAAAEGMYAGTNTGSMMSPQGEMPATGRSVSLPFSTIFHVENDRITEHHAYWDMVTFMGQLGLLPEEPPGA
jgi:steroid delta-isomerase-like uncharacterized protein